MITVENKKRNSNSSWKVWVFSSVLVALAVIFTRLLSVNIGSTIRIGLGRFPTILACFFYGPFVGFVVGAVSDFIGAMMFTGWNFSLTVPAALAGLLPYLFIKLFRVGSGGLGGKESLRSLPGIILTVVFTKVITQGILMSFLLAIMYNGMSALPELLLTRNIITVCEAAAESAIIYVLYTNKAVYGAACKGLAPVN